MGSKPTEIPVTVLLDRASVVSQTRIGVFSPYVVVLDTTLPDQGIELHSTYVGHEHTRTVASHLVLAPEYRETLVAERDHEQIPVPYGRQRCLYDHLLRLQDLCEQLGINAQIPVSEDALGAVAR